MGSTICLDSKAFIFMQPVKCRQKKLQPLCLAQEKRHFNDNLYPSKIYMQKNVVKSLLFNTCRVSQPREVVASHNILGGIRFEFYNKENQNMCATRHAVY